MEIQVAKLRLPAGGEPSVRYEQQGVVSWWLEHLLAARLKLNLPSSEVDPLDNLVNNFLASVLVLGLQPPLETVRRIERGSVEVSSFLLDPMTPRVRRYRCRQHGSVALLVHGLHALGATDDWGYHKVASIGYDCFTFAANTFRPTEYDAQVYGELAMNFDRYSTLIDGAISHSAEPD